MKIKLTQEQIDTMSYDDVANLVLQSSGQKMKTQDLFSHVIKAMELPDTEYTNGIGDFFELLLTDKRFIMLENGYWDLKINHSTKIVFDEDDEEELELVDEIETDEEEADAEINYDEDTVEDDDTEDELEDLIVLDETDESEML